MNQNQNQMIEEDEIDLSELFSTIKENIFTILFITILSIFMAFAYIYWGKSTYSSTVIISLDSKEKNNNLGQILGGAMLGNLGIDMTTGDNTIELAKITLKSKKYFNTIIDKLDNGKEFYIKRNFRKIELDNFSNLKIDITYKEENLYEEYFKIIPIDDKKYLLKIEAIDYNAIQYYGKKIKNQYFTLIVQKTNGIDPYNEIKKKDNSLSLWVREFSIKHKLNKLDKVYIFRTLSKDTRVENLIDNINVNNEGNSDIFKITYKNTLSKKAKDIITALSKNFIEYNLDNREEEYERNLRIINSQLQKINVKRKNKIKELTEYQQESAMTLMLSKGESDIPGKMEKREQQIEHILLQIEEIKNFKNSLEQNILSSIALITAGINTTSIQPLMNTLLKDNEAIRELELQHSNINSSVTSNMLISSLIQELKDKQNTLQMLLSDFTEHHPQVIQQQKEVADLTDSIRSNITLNLDKLRQNRDIVKSTILTNMSMVESSLSQKLDVIKSNIKEKKSVLNTIPSKQMTQAQLMKDFQFDEKIYTVLLQKKVETEISKSTIIANTKVIENAYIAKKADSPKVLLILVVSAITGMIFGIFFVFFRSFLNKKIRKESDIENITDTPIVGTISSIANQEAFQKELKNIGTSLYFNKSPNSCSRVLISSMKSGEGKTIISAELAKIMAKTGKKVLIIDLNLRKPTLHKEFKQKNRIGISDYLSETVELYDIVFKVNNYLDFIPAGSISSDVYLFLMSDRFKNLIKKLEQKYDFIIFDTKAIDVASDTKVLLHYSNMVLLVVMANVSEEKDIITFDKIRRDSGVESVGIILNEV
jgi:capsular exopolysaccharide synthesis family protein